MTPIKTFALTACALATLGACAATAPTPAASNLSQIQSEFPDMDATEFARLDDNNDGMLDASERQDIGEADDVLGPNVVVDDN